MLPFLAVMYVSSEGESGFFTYTFCESCLRQASLVGTRSWTTTVEGFSYREEAIARCRIGQVDMPSGESVGLEGRVGAG